MSDEGKILEDNAENDKDCKKFNVNDNNECCKTADSQETCESDQNNKCTEEVKDREIGLLKEQLEKKDEELKSYIELAQRVKAEFDNYKKRTLKEKEQLYTEITADIILKMLPVVDNMERAVSSASESKDMEKLHEGMNMILKQIKDILSKEGVEEIAAENAEFDPNYHNAVMHIEDETVDSNMVVEVFQKGYKIKDKVLRHSMVKVAN